jgi:hypothetical protein
MTSVQITSLLGDLADRPHVVRWATMIALAAAIPAASCRQRSGSRDRRDAQGTTSRAEPEPVLERTPLLHPAARFIRLGRHGSNLTVSYQFQIELGDYFPIALRKLGWHGVGTGDLAQDRCCGSNDSAWLHAKDHKRLELTVCGTSVDVHDPERVTHSYRAYFYLFDGLTPEEVFGRQYRQNPMPLPIPRKKGGLDDGLFSD